MTIELQTREIPASTFKVGSAKLSLNAGESLIIERAGIEELNEIVPQDKSWEVNIQIKVVEEDV